MLELLGGRSGKQSRIRFQLLGINQRLLQRQINVKVIAINTDPPLKKRPRPPLTGGYRQLGVVCGQRVPEKVHVYQRIAGADSTLGRIDEKLRQKVDCVRRSVREKLLERHRSELGEGNLVVVRE